MFLNVLEFDFVTQIPLSVLEFMALFLNVLDNIFYVLLHECTNYQLLQVLYLWCIASIMFDKFLICCQEFPGEDCCKAINNKKDWS